MYAYVCICMYMYVSEVGGVSPTGKSASFRSCVRACERARRGEAACGCETTLLPWLGFGTSDSPPPARGAGAGRALPFAVKMFSSFRNLIA